MDLQFRRSVRALTERFVADLLAAVDDSMRRRWLTDDKGSSRGQGRRPRRDRVVIDAVVAHIARIAAEHPDGISSAKLLQELGLPRAQVMKPMALALSSRKIKRSGWARGTMYFPGQARRKKG